MISIIICFYERINHLRYCLDSLRFSQNDFDEVIISDDGSSEKTGMKLKKLIPAYDFPIKHVWQPKKGFRVAAARNNGIRNAKGDYLIFSDCDFLILPGTIAEHVKRAQRKRFVAGTSKFLTEEQTQTIFATPLEASLLENYYNSLPIGNPGKEHQKYIMRTLLMRLRLLPPEKQSLGGNFSIHKSDIEYINGYDEQYVGWGGEDEDLGIRLVKAGIYCKSAIPYVKILHMWHPRQLGNVHWKEGPNIDYFKRKRDSYFCENGLKKF